ncbi:DUF4192 domain-containing protein [Amycolatopsis nalaikhensis]|uniref:DUF4192 domain-containing protein n=1 Tax=Amycolatopsis nalaikhensis TaxID=715472 RepID=A0ABY8XAE6_9PSEU|nr:DUF4192 domain-containing protein [Amycolatopsis sp. 2-2]WIV52865.1 DUF4192 domain-containing protein [Amycolatopsis sp. 2-2]
MPEQIYLTDENLLAAIPALLGFTPTNSLVIVAAVEHTDGSVRLGRTTRFDLDLAVRLPRVVVADLSRALGDQPVQRLIGAVVHDTSATDDLPYRSQLHQLVHQLHESGFTSIEFLHVPSFTAGATWSCYDAADHTGTLPDPAASPITADRVINGDRIYSNRDAFLAQFVPAPADIRTCIAALADPIAEDVQAEELAGDLPRLRRRLQLIDDAVTAATHGRLPTDHHEIAELIAALSSFLLRDIHLIQDTEQRCGAAQSLWLHLWRHAPARYAPTMTALTAVTAYLRKDGSVAGLIIQRDPRPTKLSQLVRRWIREGAEFTAPHTSIADVAQQLRTALTESTER